MESLLTDESSPVWVVRYMSEAEADNLIDLCTRKLEGVVPGAGAGSPEARQLEFRHEYRALLLRAAAYVKRGKFHLALEDYNAMLRHNPKNTDVLYNRWVGQNGIRTAKEAILAGRLTKFSAFLPLSFSLSLSLLVHGLSGGSPTRR